MHPDSKSISLETTLADIKSKAGVWSEVIIRFESDGTIRACTVGEGTLREIENPSPSRYCNPIT